MKIPIVIVDRDGQVLLGPGAYGHDDPRLRRAQAAAPEEVTVSVASSLIVPKIIGQASVAESRLERNDVGGTLRQVALAIEDARSVDEVRRLEATAAAYYFDAWTDHPFVVPRFTKAEAKRIPAHWSRYDGRRSLLGKGNSNRKGERPTNCVLNLLYALAAVEVRLACLSVGLD
ncbi:MAG: CRISPR-associated endonuclease Cas1, partial [Acidimicrobiales bacterium]